MNGPRIRCVALALSAVAMFASCASDAAPSSEAVELQQATPIESTLPAVTESAEEIDIPQVCAELQDVQDSSREIAVATNDLLVTALDPDAGLSPAETLEAFATIADDIDALLPNLLESYERAAAIAPADIAVEIRAVSNGTALLTPPLLDVYRSAESADDIRQLEEIFASPEMQTATQAAGIGAVRIDNFTVPNCGFKFSNT